jgi:molybdate transport system regulatory protein
VDLYTKVSGFIMNQLKGIVTNIQCTDGIMLVDSDVLGQNFSALMIASSEQNEWLRVGNTIDIIFKETEVSLGKNITGKLSFRNKLSCIVKSVNRGEILSVIELKYFDSIIKSAITTRSVDCLDIQIDDNIIAFIKTNEIILTEILG